MDGEKWGLEKAERRGAPWNRTRGASQAWRYCEGGPWTGLGMHIKILQLFQGSGVSGGVKGSSVPVKWLLFALPWLALTFQTF